MAPPGHIVQQLTGCDLAADPTAAAYWTALYVVTLALLVLGRLALPLYQAWRYRPRVAEVSAEGPGVVSLWITGRRLDRLGALSTPGFPTVSRYDARGAAQSHLAARINAETLRQPVQRHPLP